MSVFDLMRRAWVVGLLAVVGATAAVFPADAQTHSSKAQSAAAATTLPEPLTHESVRELVSRLSDEQVRQLLLQQLDRAAVPEKAKGRSGMSGMIERNAAMMRARLVEFQEAIHALPETLREVVAKLDEPDGPTVLPRLAALVALMLAIGWAVQRGYQYALRNYRNGIAAATAQTFSARAIQLGVRLSLDLIGVAVFALGALALFLALWQGHGLRRIAILELLIAIVVARMTWLVAEFLLSSGAEEKRLLPFADVPARRLRRFAVAIAVLWGAFSFVNAVMIGAEVTAATVDLFQIVNVVLSLAIVLWTVWRVRAPIAHLIRGEGKHNVISRLLADLWPVIATAFFLIIGSTRIFDIFSATPVVAGAGMLTLLLVMALPMFDMFLCRALAAAARAPAVAGATAPGFVAAYETVLRHAIHIVVVVLGLLVLARLWEVDLFAFAEASLGGKISSSLLGICIVLLLAYMLWEVARTAIDRRLLAEGDQAHDVPASRVQTLLPLLRALILVTIVVMATMSFLAALGVDILPLLAGASVVGVAIGFGSQTLVRDIVSGAFFLMDDAFRLGEYIEVGADKGTVEKINVRSLFLRHHRGALNILPYGEIKRLRNTSRDWRVVVMEFRLTYDTNIMKVKKILKKIGEELAADPDYKDDLIQPLKSQGVMAAEDSAIVVRAKFTAKPSSTSFMIRRVAYDKIISAFLDAGIKFAHKEVTVNVPSTDESDTKVKIAGAAARAALAEEATPANDDKRG